MLAELRRKSPKNQKGRRKNKLFQWLSPDLGHPALRSLLSGLIFMAKAHKDYEVYHSAVDKAAPKYNQTLLLPFPDEDSLAVD